MSDEPFSADTAEVAPVAARATPMLPSMGRVNAEIAEAILNEIGGAQELARHLNEIIRDAVSVTKGGVATIDYKARLSALQLALYYIVGKPIERQQIVTAKVESESEDELMLRLARSPAMREALREVLAEAEKKQG